MEVESCHVSSGGISWPSVSVYRRKIFIYHFTACIKDEIWISSMQCSIGDTHQIHTLFWSRFVNIFILTQFSLDWYFIVASWCLMSRCRVSLQIIPQNIHWMDKWPIRGWWMQLLTNKKWPKSQNDPLQSPSVRIFMRNILLVVSAAYLYLCDEGFYDTNDWK